MNNILEKIKKGNVLAIAGRACMGKTVIGINIATRLAETKKVLYVYTESKLPVESSEFKFDFINVSTISDIMCAILKNECDVVMIDSFLYMRNHKLEDTAYMLKTIAQELDVAVVVQSHIPRKCDLRKDKRPKYSDIKYKKMCGYLYKYSDNIVFLYRDYYYFPEKYDELSNYRIDRITKITMLDTPAKPLKSGINLPKHMAEHIYMFAGDSVRAKFRAKNYIIDQVIDWYGKDATIIPENDDECIVMVNVNKNAFFCWAMQYGEHIEVLAPIDVREKIISSVREIEKKYSKKE